MSGHPANWHIYTQGDPVLRPRRRNIFHKGRRRSDRWMARLIVLMGLALVALSVKAFWLDVQDPPAVRTVAVSSN
jgi:hypothetical protein